MNYQKRGLLLLVFCAFMFSCNDNKKSSDPTADSSTNVLHRLSEQGEKWDVLGSKITGKILSEDTNGEYSVIITETPPNGGPPKHTHTHEDELFYVMQGSYEFSYGDSLIKAEQGDMIHLPKGRSHSFKNVGSTMGKTMNTITPGGFEGFFADISTLSEQDLLGPKQIDSLSKLYEVRFVKAQD